MTQATSHKQNNYIAWFSAIVIVLVVELVVVFAVIPIREAPHDDLSPAAKEALAASEEAARAAKRAGRAINHSAGLPKDGTAAHGAPKRALPILTPHDIEWAKLADKYPLSTLLESNNLDSVRVLHAAQIQFLSDPKNTWIWESPSVYDAFQVQVERCYWNQEQMYLDVLECGYSQTVNHYSKQL